MASAPLHTLLRASPVFPMIDELAASSPPSETAALLAELKGTPEYQALEAEVRLLAASSPPSHPHPGAPPSPGPETDEPAAQTFSLFDQLDAMTDEPEYIPVGSIPAAAGDPERQLSLMEAVDTHDVAGSEHWGSLLGLIRENLARPGGAALPRYVGVVARFFPDLAPVQQADLLDAVIDAIGGDKSFPPFPVALSGASPYLGLVSLLLECLSCPPVLDALPPARVPGLLLSLFLVLKPAGGTRTCTPAAVLALLDPGAGWFERWALGAAPCMLVHVCARCGALAALRAAAAGGGGTGGGGGGETFTTADAEKGIALFSRAILEKMEAIAGPLFPPVEERGGGGERMGEFVNIADYNGKFQFLMNCVDDPPQSSVRRSGGGEGGEAEIDLAALTEVQRVGFVFRYSDDQF
ncbi:hypothetical protein TeGR_g6994 [Tetraparma gracilis]|uniref:Uncharacterized protein n=1 Tax=Tetraparma gracilis TaxID=2962635 RepID=A0ABQ6N4N2_9STRA|nr:hypothetical protein TeGR_g6994 [Tetraparma gracilis]